MKKKKVFFIQIIKYGLVGILNTLLTAFIIWLLLYILADKGSPESPPSTIVMFIANFSGYIVGLINSFILNRNWTFRSKSDWKASLFRFLIAFGVCYCVQLAVVLILNHFFIAPYFFQLVGIVVYTILNFIFNKYYTFNK